MDTEGRPKASGQIIGLDYVRFMAAFVVVMFHLAYWSWASGGSSAYDILGGEPRHEELEYISAWGWVGVETFFVLSGFVIVYTAQGRSAQQFFVSRFVRLAPAAWLCASITAVALVVASDMSWSSILLRYISSVLFSPMPPWIDGSYWTLFVEIVFYASIWTLIYTRKVHQITGFLLALGSVSAAYWYLRLGLYLTDGDSRVPILDYLPQRVAVLLLLRHGCFFAIGGLLYQVLRGNGARSLYLAIGCFMFAGCLEIVELDANYYAHKTGVQYGWFALLFWLVSVLLIVFSVLNAAPLGRILSPSVARTVGLMTYPLYLLHQAVGATFLKAAMAAGFGRTMSLAIAILVVLFASYIIAKVVEPTFQRITKQYLEKMLTSFVKRRAQNGL